MAEEAPMEKDTTSELGEDEPTGDHYRDGWDSVATTDDPYAIDATEEGLPARPTKTLSDDR